MRRRTISWFSKMFMLLILVASVGVIARPVISHAVPSSSSAQEEYYRTKYMDYVPGAKIASFDAGSGEIQVVESHKNDSKPNKGSKNNKGSGSNAEINGSSLDSFDDAKLKNATDDLIGDLVSVIQAAGALIVLFGLYKLAHGLMSSEARDLSVSSGIILVGVILAKIDIIVNQFKAQSGDSIDDMKDILTSILFWVGAAAILFGCFEIVKGLIRKDASSFLKSGTIIGGGALCCLSKGIVDGIIGKTDKAATLDTVLASFGEIMGMLCSVFFWAGAAAIVIGVMYLISGVIKKDPSSYETSGYIIGAGAIACAIKGVSNLIVGWA